MPGIYVEIPIRASIEELWEKTQNPQLHQRWDLRFTQIEYLPRKGGEPQRFLYRTRIGFGLKIDGQGESIGERDGEGGERTSSLKFWYRYGTSGENDNGCHQRLTARPNLILIRHA